MKFKIAFFISLLVILIVSIGSISAENIDLNDFQVADNDYQIDDSLNEDIQSDNSFNENILENSVSTQDILEDDLSNLKRQSIE